MVGTWMTNTATVWLVYELTQSPLWLGVAALAGQLPAVVLGPFAGVWVDRVDRLKLLIAAQCFAMLHAGALAVLTFSGVINIWFLLGLTLFHGVVNSVDMPTRQSLSVLLADRREDLAGVIAMNASMFHLARLAGPAVAGVVIALFGAAVCFAVDAVSYIAVLVALFAMRLRKPEISTAKRQSVMVDLIEGVKYVAGSFPIRTHMLLSGAMAAFVLSYASLMPMYSDVFFHGNAETLGWMMASTAAGALIAALYLASRRSLAGIGSAIVTGALLTVAALWGFAYTRDFTMSCILLAVAGGGGILVLASNNTLIQSMLEENKRGRVMSLYGVVFFGGFPLGALFNGWLAARFGAAAAPVFSGCAGLLLAVFYVWIRPKLRVEIKELIHAQMPHP